MTSKLITKPRLAWTGILIVVLLALLFLPGIRKRPFFQNPASVDNEQKSRSQQIGNMAATLPGNAAGQDSAIPSVGDTIPPTELFRSASSIGPPGEVYPMPPCCYGWPRPLKT